MTVESRDTASTVSFLTVAISAINRLMNVCDEPKIAGEKLGSVRSRD
jgi:hypothetical protein